MFRYFKPCIILLLIIGCTYAFSYPSLAGICGTDCNILAIPESETVLPLQIITEVNTVPLEPEIWHDLAVNISSQNATTEDLFLVPTRTPILQQTRVPFPQPTGTLFVRPTGFPLPRPTGTPVIQPTATPVITPSLTPIIRPTVSPFPKPTVSLRAADLIITVVDVPPTAYPGVAFPVLSTVQNAGNVTASSSYISYFLSEDVEFDSRDIFLGRTFISTITSGSTQSCSYSATLPQETHSGSYYIWILADSTNRVKESNEGNNAIRSAVFSVIGDLKPDLVPVSLHGPAQASPGESISVKIGIDNKGQVPSQVTTVAFYVSSDRTLGSGDIYLGSARLPGIDSGATLTLSYDATIPASVASGTYYLGTCIDYSNVVEESNENNNNFFSNEGLRLIAAPGGTFEKQIEEAIIKYTNQERINNGLPPLTKNERLSEIAIAHSRDMQIRDFFSHTNPDGRDPFDRMAIGGYTFICAGENIASNSFFNERSSPDDVGKYFVEKMWMMSSGHRANILEDCFTEIGVGVVYESDTSSSPSGVIATQNFGKSK